MVPDIAQLAWENAKLRKALADLIRRKGGEVNERGPVEELCKAAERV